MGSPLEPIFLTGELLPSFIEPVLGLPLGLPDLILKLRSKFKLNTVNKYLTIILILKCYIFFFQKNNLQILNFSN